MKITIRSPFHVNEKLLDFADDKIRKLMQLSESIVEARVSLRVAKSDTGNNRWCEIKLSMPGNELIASKQCPSFEEAILNTVDALKNQLTSP